MASTRFLGIDLGTTNSAAAVFDSDTVTLIRSQGGGPLTPSVVRIDARGGVTVGARARRFLETDPKNTRSEFKRLMGTEHTIEFHAAKVSKRPVELAAAVLASIRQDVMDQLGFLPMQAVITVPALFELPQSAATSEAARLAGFERVELLQEPVASAIAAGWSAEESDARPWLVYDLGGGTFDASLLETQEGMLRVVGHDGDNFLGGRDFDSAVVELVLQRMRAQGVDVDQSDPRHATGVRRLRHLAEEAKIELSRAERAVVALPEAFDVDGPVDVDVEITRADLELAVSALVDRSVTVCLRLCASHGVSPGELGKIVMVGGPTLMPGLRERVAAGLNTPFASGIDPMTIVAQGAALFAASAQIPAEAAVESATSTGTRVWLQHPTLTADLSPFLVGKALESGRFDGVVARRDGWASDEEPVAEDGTFVVGLSLQPRRATTFTLEGRKGGAVVQVTPASFTIVHGVTLQDPPLSRSVGVARADDTVQVYFPRGSPLPIKRSFALTVVESLTAGAPDQSLAVPIVQGEFEKAHLCRLVGTLEIRAGALKQALAVGTQVEVALEMDRGGRLTASAKLAWGQVFDEVAQMVAPHLDREAMVELAASIRTRLNRAMGGIPKPDAAVVRSATEAARLLDEVGSLLRLAKGGDADAAEKARRGLIEADGEVATVEVTAAWPEMAMDLQEVVDRGRGWVSRYGSPSEQAAYDDAVRRAQVALAHRREAEVERIKGVLEGLCDAAWVRSPGAWGRAFAYWRARTGDATDPRAAQAAVRLGEEAQRKGDNQGLEAACRTIAGLIPADEHTRARSFGSGVR